MADTTPQSGSVSITLKHPVTVDGKEYKTLQMRTEVYARDQINVGHLKHNEPLQEASLMANLCEVSTDVISSLRLGDYMKLQSAYTESVSKDLVDPKSSSA